MSFRFCHQAVCSLAMVRASATIVAIASRSPDAAVMVRPFFQRRRLRGAALPSLCVATIVTFWIVSASAETPGPAGSISRLLSKSAKVPLSLEYGWSKESVPVKGLPSLHVAVIVATNDPSGALLEMLGLGGSQLNIR